MRTIHKYPLPFSNSDRHMIAPPTGHFKPLALQLQDGVPMLWAEVDVPEDEQPGRLQQRVVMLVGTGHPCPPKFMTYMGTLQFRNGSLVLHYYVDARQPA